MGFDPKLRKLVKDFTFLGKDVKLHWGGAGWIAEVEICRNWRTRVIHSPDHQTVLRDARQWAFSLIKSDPTMVGFIPTAQDVIDAFYHHTTRWTSTRWEYVRNFKNVIHFGLNKPLNQVLLDEITFNAIENFFLARGGQYGQTDKISTLLQNDLRMASNVFSIRMCRLYEAMGWEIHIPMLLAIRRNPKRIMSKAKYFPVDQPDGSITYAPKKKLPPHHKRTLMRKEARILRKKAKAKKLKDFEKANFHNIVAKTVFRIITKAS